MHFASAQEYVNVIDSKCQATGDDGLNVHTSYLLVTQIINSTAIIFTTLNHTDSYVDVGTSLEFTSNEQPFIVYGTGIIASLTVYNSSMRLLTFTNVINASVGDWVCNTDVPLLTTHEYYLFFLFNENYLIMPHKQLMKEYYFKKKKNFISF